MRLTHEEKAALLRRLMGGENDEPIGDELEAQLLRDRDPDVLFEAAASWIVSEEFLRELHATSTDSNVRRRVTWNRRAPLELLATARYDEVGGIEYSAFATRLGRPDVVRALQHFSGDRRLVLGQVWREVVGEAPDIPAAKRLD